MAGKPRALCPLFPVCKDISTASDNKVRFSCRLFWCDAIVVWANSRGLYKGKRHHLKCHTAAVAEAEEFHFRMLLLRTLSEHLQHMCTAEGAIKWNSPSPSLLMWNLSFQSNSPSLHHHYFPFTGVESSWVYIYRTVLHYFKNNGLAGHIWHTSLTSLNFSC